MMSEGIQLFRRGVQRYSTFTRVEFAEQMYPCWVLIGIAVSWGGLDTPMDVRITSHRSISLHVWA